MTSFVINFRDPSLRLEGERRSKLLDPGSDLCVWLDNKYKELVNKYGNQVGSKRMDYHIELIGRNDIYSDVLLVKRAHELENKEIDITNIGTLHRAYVLYGPELNGYGQTHITIAFYPSGVPSDLR